MAERTRRIEQLLTGLFDDERLSTLGLAGERIIRVRTREGKAVDGTPFPSAEDPAEGSPYSKGWYRARRKKELATDVKNLQYTLQGGMLAQMDHRVLAGADTGVEFYFNGERAQTLARYHNEQGAGINKMKHRFFGLSDEEARRIRDLYQEAVDDVIRTANLSA